MLVSVSYLNQICSHQDKPKEPRRIGRGSRLMIDPPYSHAGYTRGSGSTFTPADFHPVGNYYQQAAMELVFDEPMCSRVIAGEIAFAAYCGNEWLPHMKDSTTYDSDLKLKQWVTDNWGAISSHAVYLRKTTPLPDFSNEDTAWLKGVVSPFSFIGAQRVSEATATGKLSPTANMMERVIYLKSLV